MGSREWRFFYLKYINVIEKIYDWDSHTCKNNLKEHGQVYRNNRFLLGIDNKIILIYLMDELINHI